MQSCFLVGVLKVTPPLVRHLLHVLLICIICLIMESDFQAGFKHRGCIMGQNRTDWRVSVIFQLTSALSYLLVNGRMFAVFKQAAINKQTACRLCQLEERTDSWVSVVSAATWFLVLYTTNTCKPSLRYFVALGAREHCAPVVQGHTTSMCQFIHTYL